MHEWGRAKLYRKITERERYTDGNTFRLFLHLILKANIKDKRRQGITVNRGQLVTSLDTLAKQLKLSKQQIRTALKKLKATHEITEQVTNRYRLITIVNYDNYQDRNSEYNTQNNKQGNTQITHKQHTDNTQITPTKESKESKECENSSGTHKKNNWDEKKPDQVNDFDITRRAAWKRNAEIVARHVARQRGDETGKETVANDQLVKKVKTLQSTTPGIDLTEYIKNYSEAIDFIERHKIQKHFYYPIHTWTIIEFLDKLNKFTGGRDAALYATINFRSKWLLKELLAKDNDKGITERDTPTTPPTAPPDKPPAMDPEAKSRAMEVLRNAKSNFTSKSNIDG